MCSHDNVQLTRRVISNGSIQFVYQCQSCGLPVSSAISHHKARATQYNIQDFNEGLLKKHQENVLYIAKKAKEEEENKFRMEYEKYLHSDVWIYKRLLVFERDGYVCQGCLMNRATEVHHISYKHVFNEPLFDLVSICSECHRNIHEKEDQ